MSSGKLNRKRIFTPSDDALIREQPVTGLGLKTLETMLRTSRETLLRRADELGVSLVVSEHDEAVDTRVLRCTDGVVDPLLELLKQVHGAVSNPRCRWPCGIFQIAAHRPRVAGAALIQFAIL